MNRRSLLIRLGLIAGGVGAGWWLKDNVLWRGPDLRFGAEGSTGWMPFATDRTLTPTIDLMLDGRPMRALVDSGAQYSVIDRAAFASLGRTPGFDMPLVAYGLGGEPQLGRGATLELALPGLAVSGLRTAILDLGPLAAPEGLSTPLILGRDLLQALILDIDVAGRRMRMVSKDTHTLPPQVTSVPVRRVGGALMAEITVEGAVIEALIDTGSSSLLALGRETASGAGLLDGRPQQAGSSLVLGGSLSAQVVEARTVTLGDQIYRGVSTAIFQDVRAPGFPKALLGMGAFEGRRVVLDVGGGALHVSTVMDVSVEPRRRRRG